MMCPADIEHESPSDVPVEVHYDPPPTTGGGRPPVGFTCTPPSGSAFAVGTTTVNCAATDAAAQSATCAFQVTITAAPRLSLTTFLAFGDSLTEGKVSVGLTLLAGPPESYPSKLQIQLAGRYRNQTIVVVNAGVSGEQAVEGARRLPGVLGSFRPEVLLLMEGTNDLFHWRDEGIPRAIPALESMIREARGRGVHVLLATVPPQRTGGARDDVAQLVPALNREVRALASREGVPLVDVFAAMDGQPHLIGSDELHMTEQGYEFMAGVFLEAIKTTLEVGSPAAGWNR
jgi:lysophospholipase L1-like esterase